MGQTATVLVVEDERDLADLFAGWLAAEYDVRTAYDADSALDELDESVDVVLLDRRLPEATGDDVLATIREERFDCRVAMVTAVEPDFDVLEMGFDAYLVKPVERAELEGLVDRLFARSLYSDEVQRYFSLASRKATLESAKSTAELQRDERYRRVCEEFEEHRERVDALVSELDEADFLAVFQGLGEAEEP